MTVMLMVLDGFGYSKSKNSPVNRANMPFYRHLWKEHPHTLLDASGPPIGLMPKQAGNSEVGHSTLGSGRVIYQDIERINNSIKDGSFFKNRVLWSAMKRKRVHLMGLLTDGGAHAYILHLFALIKMAKKMHVPELYIHVFTDGRDVQPGTAVKYVRMLQNEIKKYKIGEITSIVGRYYAMDRDGRMSRTQKAYDLLVHGIGRKSSGAISAIKESYKNGITDEFIKPVILDENGLIKKTDSVIFFNFRPDRAKQLSTLFLKNKFHLSCFTKYSDDVRRYVFSPEKIKNTLGEVISKHNLKQLRIAETEKYAHVTYFFNSGNPRFKNEKRIGIPSPKVSTYDKKPEMSAEKLTKTLVSEMNKYDFVLVNFANPDMVGHTGNEKAVIKALNYIDKCLKKIFRSFNGVAIITADHGNAESHGTSHTTNKVPCVLVGLNQHLSSGSLANIAPTILKIMKIKIPKQMTKPLF